MIEPMDLQLINVGHGTSFKIMLADPARSRENASRDQLRFAYA
jgi:hypothetical protein